jgi:hypothetical protein
MKDFFDNEFHPTEMYKLINLLIKAKIPFEVEEWYDTPMVWYPSKKNFRCDVICHCGSYGHEKGLLETMGLTTNPDDVEGYLTAETVFERIQKDFAKRG